MAHDRYDGFNLRRTNKITKQATNENSQNGNLIDRRPEQLPPHLHTHTDVHLIQLAQWLAYITSIINRICSLSSRVYLCSPLLLLFAKKYLLFLQFILFVSETAFTQALMIEPCSLVRRLNAYWLTRESKIVSSCINWPHISTYVRCLFVCTCISWFLFTLNGIRNQNQFLCTTSILLYSRISYTLNAACALSHVYELKC